MAIRTTDFVKFIRGNQAAFDLLAVKDTNTLYFISEEGSTIGSLYLGSKLISGGTGVSELGDIVISEIGDKQILYYSLPDQAWVNGSIYDAIGVMTGATADTNGAAGLVPVPQAGQQNLFLRGDGVWAAPVATIDTADFDANIFTKNVSNKLTLVNFEEANVGDILRKSSVGNLEWVSEETLQTSLLTDVNNRLDTLQGMIEAIEGGVTRTIVNTLEDINTEAEDADKYIYMVPNANGSEGNMYDEYMVINGVVEKVGSGLSGDLTGYVTTKTFNTTVGTLTEKFDSYVSLEKYNSEVGNLSAVLDEWTKSNIVEQVDYLTDLLTWYELES